MDIGVGVILLVLSELLEGHISSETLENLLLGALECAWCDNCHLLLHLDKRLVVVLTHLFDLLDGLLHEEIVVLPVKLLFIIDESEQENIMVLGLEISDSLDILSIVVELHSDIHVLAAFFLYYHEGVLIVFLDPMSQLAAAKCVTVVLNNTLDVRLT